MNLEKKYPVRNGVHCGAYCFILPENLAKKENKDEAIRFCEENNLVYAIIDGTPRAVNNDENVIRQLQAFCTSYRRQDGLRFSFGREQADKTGGINFKHLISAIMGGSPSAISFARIAKNQNWQNIKTSPYFKERLKNS